MLLLQLLLLQLLLLQLLLLLVWGFGSIRMQSSRPCYAPLYNFYLSS